MLNTGGLAVEYLIGIFDGLLLDRGFVVCEIFFYTGDWLVLGGSLLLLSN